MKTLFVAFGVCAVALAHANSFVDDFSSGAYSVTLSGLGSDSNSQNGTMLGGTRLTQFSIDNNPYNQSATMSIDQNDANGNPEPGLFVDGGFGLSSTVELEYHGISGIPGASGFAFDFLGTDQPLNVIMEVDSNSGFADAALSVGANGNPFTLNFAPGQFSGAIDFSSISLIYVEFDTSASGDFGLQDIRSTPEPASLAVLGLGAVGLLRRRYRSRAR